MHDVLRFLYIALREYWITWVTGTGIVGFILWLINLIDKRRSQQGDKSMTWRTNIAILFCAFWFLATYSAWHDADKNLRQVISDRAIDVGNLNICRSDLKTSNALLAQSSGYLSHQQTTIDAIQTAFNNQQDSVNKCVVALGKMNPIINTHISVAAVKVASNDQAKERFYGLAIMTNRKLEPRGILKCNDPFRLSSISLSAMQNPVFVPNNTLERVNDREYSIGINYTPALWIEGNPIMAAAATNSEDDLHCTFSPQT